MKKAAFIVENDFLTNGHFGVRNFFSTIKHVMEDMGYEADYVTYRKRGHGGNVWYKVTPRYLKTPEDQCLEYWLDEKAGKKHITFADVESFMGWQQPMERYTQAIGANLEDEGYEYAFITAPWVVKEDFTLEAEHIVGIVYDCIPNLYAIAKDGTGYTFAYQHARGYKFYNENCDYIMADSYEAAMQYRIFFGHKAKNVQAGYFPPFVPWGVGKQRQAPIHKENSIILSAPFDLRKGIKEMPEFLNALDDVVDTLYIYGQPRCETQMFNRFFKELHLRHVVYYPHISSEHLVKLYARCKFLFFPSLQEGLGLPLLEAQVCGCRVITRNLAPMNQLGLDGAIYFEHVQDAVEKTRSGMMDDGFSYDDLREKAREKYLYRGIREFIGGNTNENTSTPRPVEG